MKTLSIICVIATLLFSCYKEPVTHYEAHLTNRTSVAIIIVPFKNGIASQDRTVSIPPGGTVQIAKGFDRGLVENAGFVSEELHGDSLQVVFDNLYTCSHYINPGSGSAPKNYSYTSTRNLGNYLSYQWTQTKPSKNNWHNRYDYDFTEADYQFAKQ
jgi:hypothetical protein